MNLKENAREHLLDAAINDIEENGIYWNGSISRSQRGHLLILLEEHGYEISMNEVPPHWEHAFYTSAYSYDDVLELAQKRAEESDW
ncbi:hypothetical protein [Pseudoalteromonas sp. MMG012]|uniref:hypothetical protein n=1 Tax=Pseudoalteromonas sp. MMG012 TaxID=2822686 RepID=UPI001B3A6503|nr:hypothetical protein [Pseudoalteromonas sp. MMG012]MBQ4852912.1 hypothetical protein [Pseudoalteromonas sp. MMG012]